jgi:hypothetical protein
VFAFGSLLPTSDANAKTKKKTQFKVKSAKWSKAAVDTTLASDFATLNLKLTNTVKGCNAVQVTLTNSSTKKTIMREVGKKGGNITITFNSADKGVWTISKIVAFKKTSTKKWYNGYWDASRVWRSGHYVTFPKYKKLKTIKAQKKPIFTVSSGKMTRLTTTKPSSISSLANKSTFTATLLTTDGVAVAGKTLTATIVSGTFRRAASATTGSNGVATFVMDIPQLPGTTVMAFSGYSTSISYAGEARNFGRSSVSVQTSQPKPEIEIVPGAPNYGFTAVGLNQLKIKIREKGSGMPLSYDTFGIKVDQWGGGVWLSGADQTNDDGVLTIPYTATGPGRLTITLQPVMDPRSWVYGYSGYTVQTNPLP